MTFTPYYISPCVSFCLETRLLKAITQRWNIHSVPGCRILHRITPLTGNEGDIGFTLPFRLEWHMDIKERQGHVRCVQPLSLVGKSAGKSTVWYAEAAPRTPQKKTHGGNKKKNVKPWHFETACDIWAGLLGFEWRSSFFFMIALTESCSGISFIDLALFLFMYVLWHLPCFFEKCAGVFILRMMETIFISDQSAERSSLLPLSILLLKHFYNFFFFSSPFFCLRLGEVGGSLCHVSESRHKDREPGKTQRISIDEGKVILSVWFMYIPLFF